MSLGRSAGLHDVGAAGKACADGALRPPAGCASNGGSPTAKWRVIGLACLGLLAGPLAILALLGVPIAILALGVWDDSAIVRVIGLNILIINGVAAWVLARALQAEVPTLDGLPVTRPDAPKLFAMIDDLQVRLKAPKIDRVILNDRLNATVSQSPRFFGLAGHRHDLTLGLPLLQALSTDECAAVVAHELAHLRRSDGKLNALVFRVRRLWSRLAAVAAHNAIPGCSLIAWFAHWYRPMFEQASCDVLRDNEFRADAVSTSIVGRTQTASALMRVALAQSFLEDLWAAYWLKNVDHPLPGRGPWASFAEKLPAASQWPQAGQVLGRALNSGSAGQHSHPGLAERLGRIGMDAASLRFVADVPVSMNAARALLGEFSNHAVSHFDHRWWVANKERWETFYYRVDDQHARLAALDQAAAADGLSVDTALERAARSEYLLGAAPAIERYMWCLARYPNEAAGYYSLGRFLLDQGDNRGIRHLVHAMSLDELAIPDATARVISYLEGQGELRRARIYRRKADVWRNGQREHCPSLDYFAGRGRLTALTGDPRSNDKLQAVLRNVNGIVSAWLVQTPLQPWSDAPRAHLVVEHARGQPAAWSARRWDKLCKDLSLVPDMQLFEMSELSPEAQYAIRNVDDGLIWSRSNFAVGSRKKTHRYQV